MPVTMEYDFDRHTARASSDSLKWLRYGSEVIPLWIADMDFPSADPIVEALHRRVDEGVFGYVEQPGQLAAVVVDRLKRLFDFPIVEQDVVFLPAVVTGLNLAFRLYTEPGEGVLIQPPVYPHFMDALAHGRFLADPPLVQRGGPYEIDFAALRESITDRTRVFLLCNPHNPVGRVYGRSELETLAEICLSRDMIICSDEVHCDLLYPGHRHIPIASLDREVARRTITLMAPSKTFNLAGLGCAFAVIEDPALRDIWTKGSRHLIPHVNIMGLVAALAGYTQGQEWLDQVLSYLKGNRDFLAKFVQERLPGIRMTPMEATYLAWLDCREAGIPGNPFRYFLKQAKVALNDGIEFGKGGEGFVRLNFGCPRDTLEEALQRMEQAL